MTCNIGFFVLVTCDYNIENIIEVFYRYYIILFSVTRQKNFFKNSHFNISEI